MNKHGTGGAYRFPRDGSNVETNFTSFGIVTFRGLKLYAKSDVDRSQRVTWLNWICSLNMECFDICATWSLMSCNLIDLSLLRILSVRTLLIYIPIPPHRFPLCFDNRGNELDPTWLFIALVSSRHCGRRSSPCGNLQLCTPCGQWTATLSSAKRGEAVRARHVVRPPPQRLRTIDTE